MNCVRDGLPARFQCTQCLRAFCGACVTMTKVGRREIPICPMCGGPVREITKAEPSGTSFWEYLVTSPIYPFTGKGALLIVLNGVFVGACLAIGSVALLVGLFVRLFAVGYIYWLFFNIVQKNALEKDEPPSMPDLESFGEVFSVLFKVLILFAVWATPALVVAHAAEGIPGNLLQGIGMALSGPFGLWAFVIGPAHPLGLRIVAGLCLLFVPMSLLAVATFNSVRGVHPVPLVRTMVRAPIQYFACCVAFYAAIAVIFIVWGLFATQASAVIGIIAFPLVLVYCVFVVGRILGGLHAANRERFGWVRS
jgi:hypothetical protein